MICRACASEHPPLMRREVAATMSCAINSTAPTAINSDDVRLTERTPNRRRRAV